jgi:hypothetical protein
MGLDLSLAASHKTTCAALQLATATRKRRRSTAAPPATLAAAFSLLRPLYSFEDMKKPSSSYFPQNQLWTQLNSRSYTHENNGCIDRL